MARVLGNDSVTLTTSFTNGLNSSIAIKLHCHQLIIIDYCIGILFDEDYRLMGGYTIPQGESHISCHICSGYQLGMKCHSKTNFMESMY